MVHRYLSPALERQCGREDPPVRPIYPRGRSGKRRIIFMKKSPSPFAEVGTVDDICVRFNLGRTTLWKLRKEAHFPRPILIGKRGLRWYWEEITAWFELHRI